MRKEMEAMEKTFGHDIDIDRGVDRGEENRAALNVKIIGFSKKI